MSSRQTLRIVTLACCAAATLFWLYTFYFIAQLPEGDGTGFQWVAEMPLSGIFLIVVLPAFFLSRNDRTLPLAATLAALSLLLYWLLWGQLLTEFAPSSD